MKLINSYHHWLEVVEKESALLLFVKTTNCSVCEGLYPQIENLQKEVEIPFYVVNAAEVPEMAGQLSLYTAPVVLFYKNKKEYQRYARFVKTDDVRRILKELNDMENYHD
ncbi:MULTISPECIES: thioredoxin family protein [Bacillaceae]|uniref:thioredoxin family protein n=1 Tax=Bacillaceae TaxID=186817 RepID=UPI0006F940F1|nr:MULTISPECIES: thioredoxin family protein [Bacillaceae]KQL35974.1 thioredoxin [Psychrobacillus sp. FJAT-21963]MDF2066859.1 thioredoxin family protein [Bacillus sp. Cr_A10]